MPAFEAVRPTNYLSRLAQSDIGKSYKALATSALALGAGDVIVDLGCGPGTDLSAYAEAVGPTGTLIGIDHDERLAEAARQTTSHLSNVSIEVADIHSLPLGTDVVDRVHADRVLQHVSSPPGYWPRRPEFCGAPEGSCASNPIGRP
jgi:ubiquinone/menaquinone biosynthesis C-methylase UbiE